MSTTALMTSLENVRRRVRVLSVVYGVGIVLAASVGLLLLTIGLDYLLDLPAVPRLIVILAAVAGVGYTIARWVVRPLLARLQLSDVAGRIENAFPVFDDRLRSTIDFVTKGTPGSEVMKGRVVDQATAMANTVNVANVVTTRPVWNSMGIGVGAVALCLILATVISPNYLRAAMHRLLTPFSGQAWPKRTEIKLENTIPPRIPVGQRVDVRIRLTKGDKPSAKAILYCQYEANGPIQEEVMNRNSDGTFSASLDARTEPGHSTGQMKIWMRSDDDRKDLPMVQVVEQLSIRGVDASVSSPPYVTPKTTASLDLTSAAGTVTIGSTVELRVTFNKALAAGRSVSLEAAGKGAVAPDIQWDAVAEGSQVATGHFIARDAVHFRIHATDADKFASSGIEEYQILVRPDQPPTIQFEQPTRNQENTPNAVVKLQALAEDDFGINTVQLKVTRLGDKKTWTLPLIQNAAAIDPAQWQMLDGTADRLRFRMNFDWDLAKLDTAALKPGDTLEYYLQAQDNYADEHGNPHDPQFAESGHLRISIISEDEMQHNIEAALQQHRGEANLVDHSEKDIRASTQDLKASLDKKPAADNADRTQAGQLANRQSAAASEAKSIADKLGEIQKQLTENKIAAPELSANVADAQKLMQHAAESPMQGAASKLGDVKEQKSDPNAKPEEQKKQAENAKDSLDQAQNKQGDASAAIEQAMDKMGAPTGLAEQLKAVDEILKKQKDLSDQRAKAAEQTLGKEPAQLTPEEKKTLEQIAKEQAALGKKADQMIADMNKASNAQSKADPESSAALAKAAKTGQSQGISGNMQQAAKSTQQNQQSPASAAQKQVEIGLQMMHDELALARDRQLDKLIAQLADAQQQIAELIQQQASHNLDNLTLQGGNALAEAIKADPALIAALIAESGRDVQHLPPAPSLDTLVALQAQTESNTRHAVPVIEALPDGAEPAAHLTHAAEQMSRAVTYLQDKQLTQAYQPPQVEAIEALRQAKKNVDDALTKANDKKEEQQKEAIRQRYIKIRDDQVALDAQTKSINDAPRAADGKLSHEAGIKLQALPTQQAGLSKRTADMHDDLMAVGGIAYTYANDDLVKKMNKVKGALDKLDPGTTTQVTQTRIVRQLDAMIKDLAIKPKKKPFEDTNGAPSGKSGSGAPKPPKLPSEAEIRLIQDMQKALNEDVQDANDAKVKDKTAITDLGQRQNDLRDTLDKVLQKASEGKVSLGPRPANKDTLPEEAKDEDIDLQDLKDKELNANPDAKSIDDDTALLGTRMARAGDRLALNNDPGDTTQAIQKRIVANLEMLAKMAQQQQSQSSPKPGSGQGKPQQSKPGPGGQPGNDMAKGDSSKGPNKQGGQSPATSDNPGGGLTDSGNTVDPSVLAERWAAMSPRERAAVMEGSSDKTIGKFRNFVDGYYRTLAQKASQQ